jgi:hypothetical protein
MGWRLSNKSGRRSQWIGKKPPIIALYPNWQRKPSQKRYSVGSTPIRANKKSSEGMIWDGLLEISIKGIMKNFNALNALGQVLEDGKLKLEENELPFYVDVRLALYPNWQRKLA